MPRGDGQKRKRVWKRCLICGKQFWVHWYRRNDAKYCGPKCCGKAIRKVKHRPTKEQLEHLLQTCTLAEIGEQYGVDGSLIVHWLKELGLRPLNHAERAQARREQEAQKYAKPPAHRGHRKRKEEDDGVNNAEQEE